MKATDIQWDTDGHKEILEALPKEVEIPNNIAEEDIAYYLSDLTGFCVIGFYIEE